MSRKVTPVGGMGWMKHGFTLQIVKDWREREHNLGRPSGLDDFYRAHGLCCVCRAEGNLLTGVSWRDKNGVEQNRSLGTEEAPVGIAQLVELHDLDNSRPWNYTWARCEACNGTGKIFSP